MVGTTPSVQYAYTEMSGGQNNSRLTSMTYPNGRVLTNNYNTGLDSNISRLSSISDTSATLESYIYLGLGTVVERDHPQPNVNQTFISQTGGTGDAGDPYTGLDRFGRVAEQNWVNASTHTSTDDFQYGYDQDGNAQYQNNMVDSVFSALFHQSGAGNGYDGLNQQTSFARGTLSASQQGGQLDTVANPASTESWNMAALGNFASVTLNGTQTNETTNQQNELTAVGANSLTFDKNGNMLTDAQGHSYSYNAWNELVTVKNGSSVLDAYRVDGLGRRATENTGTLMDLYFSSQGQVVEEDVAGSMQDQYVWSPVYVNAMIERDTPTQRLYVQQDADWNVTALLNTSGQVVERYVYDPYGAVTYLTPTWGSESQSAYGWHYLFQGGRLDTATGLYHFDHRDYAPTLGRWLEPDPLGFNAGDNNLYRFVEGNPVDRVDPTGYAPEMPDKPPGFDSYRYPWPKRPGWHDGQGRRITWDPGADRHPPHWDWQGIRNTKGKPVKIRIKPNGEGLDEKDRRKIRDLDPRDVPAPPPVPVTVPAPVNPIIVGTISKGLILANIVVTIGIIGELVPGAQPIATGAIALGLAAMASCGSARAGSSGAGGAGGPPPGPGEPGGPPDATGHVMRELKTGPLPP